jgi:hypothetical protein
MGMKRILVNRSAIEHNAEVGFAALPVYTVIEGEEIRYGNSLVLMGPSVMKYDPNGSPEMGRRVWIETLADVITHGGSNGDLTEEELALLDTPCGDCEENAWF